MSVTTTTYWTVQILPEGRRVVHNESGASRIFTPLLLARMVENFDPNTDVPFYFFVYGLPRVKAQLQGGFYSPAPPPPQGKLRGGRVIGLKHRSGEGLWANCELDSTGTDYFLKAGPFRALQEDPKTQGVSAQISNDFRVEYVIATSNPAISRMAGWERYR